MNSFPAYLITGLSGAGKSQAIQTFEDMGFYCVDNLPSELVNSFIDHYREHRRDFAGVAMVLDVRAGDFVSEFPALIDNLDEPDLNLTTIFLEASRNVLLNRYKEARRPHPLGAKFSLEDAIETERERMNPVRNQADIVIDTSRMTSHQFRGRLTDLHGSGEFDTFTISLTSFGFKHGVPDGVDTLFDTRFLANPHYEPDLKPQPGMASEVKRFFEEESEAESYLKKLQDLLDQVIDGYSEEGKKHLSVGVGCTGGQHRSVYLVHELGKYYDERPDTRSVITHRDLERDPEGEGPTASGSLRER
jgi:UPF0042 nucleotide-binding protein